MQKIQCEMCGGVDVVKDGDFYVCQNCGTKYTPESARKLLVQIDYETGRDKDLKELKALRQKLQKEASLEGSKKEAQAKLDNLNGQLGKVRIDPLPTNQRENYEKSVIDRLDLNYEKRVRTLNILFIVATVIAAGLAMYSFLTQKVNLIPAAIYLPMLFVLIALFVPYNYRNTRGPKIFTIIILVLISVVATAMVLLLPGGKLSPIKEDAVRKGAIIKFGKYEQDNDLSNGREDIEWYVLRSDENGILLISKNVLDFQKFAEEKGGFSPESSSYQESIIRTWLAAEFAANAFSKEELEQLQYIIPLDEKVSLPTKEDVNLADKINRQSAKPTEYAKSVYKNETGHDWFGNTDYASYWLKDTDEDATWSYKSYYYDRGIKEERINYISRSGVRPVILLKANESEGD